MESKTKNENGIYTEPADFANNYRSQQQQELLRFIEQMREKADIEREKYLKPDYSSLENYEKGMEKYRNDFVQALGYPEFMHWERNRIPEADVSFVAEDRYGKIYRLIIHASDYLSTYGLLYLPRTGFPCPLVIAQHGGGGTPEKIAELNGQSAYSNIIRRILGKGVAVFAPQTTTWSGEHGPAIDRTEVDGQLKHMGSSLAAVEIYKIMRSLDYLLSRNDFNPEKVGMVGLSFGGFYTLYTAAADTRIKAAIASCSFNSKYAYFRPDCTWKDSAVKFLDAEVCALVCPRRLYIEVGMYDTVFDYQTAEKEHMRAEKYYKNAGIADRLVFTVHPYGHVFDHSDAGIEFLIKGLNT